MMNKMNNNVCELLAPCGGMEQLNTAIKYGADALYIGSSGFSLRANAENFDDFSMNKAVETAHKHDKKIYVAMNSVIKPDRIDDAYKETKRIIESGADAIIIADPAMISIVRSLDKDIEMHLSTQVNTCNQLSTKFWHEQGIKRVVMARECTMQDIAKIKAFNPDVDIEAFVHGAMCIAYSGRCLLSSYFTGRSANCGDCAQTCRWQFDITEVKRPEHNLTIEQYGQATYILSSRDLNMIRHIKDLIDAGVYSLKIEGRMKTAFYVGTIVRAYRKAIDAVLEGKPITQEIIDETYKTSHRRYTTGFFYGNPIEEGQQYDSSSYVRDYEFSGIVLDYFPEKKQMLIEQRSKFVVGDTLEVLTPGDKIQSFVVGNMYDEDGNKVESAPHPQQKLYIDVDFPVEKNDFIRRQLHELQK